MKFPPKVSDLNIWDLGIALFYYDSNMSGDINYSQLHGDSWTPSVVSATNLILRFKIIILFLIINNLLFLILTPPHLLFFKILLCSLDGPSSQSGIPTAGQASLEFTVLLPLFPKYLDNG